MLLNWMWDVPYPVQRANSMHPKSPTNLWNIQYSANRLKNLTCGKTFDDYEETTDLRLAVERNLMILGGAMSALANVDLSTAAQFAGLDEFIAIHATLIRDYRNIVDRRVWDAVETCLPAVIQTVESLMEGVGRSEYDDDTAQDTLQPSTSGGGVIPEVNGRRDDIRLLCRQYGVRRLDLFGSAVNSLKFDPDRSDLDFLVEFQPVASMGSTYFRLAESLGELFGRSVDLVMASAIRNPYFRKSIEQTKVNIYDASYLD